MFRYSGCGCLVAQIALQDWQCGVEWWDEVPVQKILDGSESFDDFEMTSLLSSDDDSDIWFGNDVDTIRIVVICIFCNLLIFLLP